MVISRSIPFFPNTCGSASRHNLSEWIPGRSIAMPIWPHTHVTRALYCSRHAPPSVYGPSHRRGYFVSRPCYMAYWYRTRSEAIDIPSCGAGGRTRLFHCVTWTSHPRPIWTPSGASGCVRGNMMRTWFHPPLHPMKISPPSPRHDGAYSRCAVTQTIPSPNILFHGTSLLSCGHTHTSLPLMSPWRRWRSSALVWADSSHSNVRVQL